ncbi:MULTISPECIES: dienelactone hydrolase family protein [Vitreoscilla]|uniref:Dienelactone hydrolase family protein n=1 Tax=Vitreoscilla stercoraria TaxID=61 RepID=A0ABY4EBN1_VITST|nr:MULTISPECIES: dienelactone hydrolase family protein [Vitreoscilla]AUZ05804.1 dienelactone hydrolase family protein [Vitreoscilla sp. C1]UOO92819.1 dienelactone hydrolase family protein [Vitreoscilla stercoraria]
MNEQWLSIASDDGFQTQVFVVRPEKPAKAAVLVAMEIFGVNSHIQDVCRRLAKEGYLAMAPQLFDRVETNVNMAYGAADIEHGKALKQEIEVIFKAPVMSDIQACIDWAYDNEHVNKVGMMGFCWGGLNTWRAAQQAQGLWAAICYYGGGMVAEVELQNKPIAPVLAHFSDNDMTTPMDGIDVLREKYADEVVVYVYPAAHGFNCNQRAAYNEGAAEVAWQRSMAFLRMCLA